MAKPVVATPVGGVTELLEDGRSGILIPTLNRDPKRLSQALCLLLENSLKRIELGKGALARVRTRFNREQKLDELEALLQREIDQKQSVKNTLFENRRYDFCERYFGRACDFRNFGKLPV